jgi:hypothetical protein
MRRSLPALRGRRDSLRSDPADPAGALAAVMAGQQHASIPGPVRAARADRRAAALAAAAALICPARTAAGPAGWRWSLSSWPGGHCLNALRPVHEHPPVSGGRGTRGAVINQEGVQLTDVDG